jgi:hypothetical protein
LAGQGTPQPSAEPKVCHWLCHCFFDDLNTVINIIRCTALAEPIPANHSKFSY